MLRIPDAAAAGPKLVGAFDAVTAALVETMLIDVACPIQATPINDKTGPNLMAIAVMSARNVDIAGSLTHTVTDVGTHDELLATVPRYRYLLAADDELDDGREPQPIWETDDARARLNRTYEEAYETQAAGRRPAGYAGGAR